MDALILNNVILLNIYRNSRCSSCIQGGILIQRRIRNIYLLVLTLLIRDHLPVKLIKLKFKMLSMLLKLIYTMFMEFVIQCQQVLNFSIPIWNSSC